ncbi:MAG: Nif3-like dinuclear metal center hexameric protein [Tissierellia bacterium]|nr:Nif3-like dinuclear metal center hexameric protein [Tissierellia bacterium]
MVIRDLIDKLEKKFPLDLQEEWDNSGLQFGNINNDLKNIIISLDFEEETIENAIKKNCNLIITHHPYLFEAVKRMDFRDKYFKRIQKAIKNDITVYSMHTNLDKAEDGVNDNLCEVLDIKDIKILDDESNIGRIGTIKRTTARDFGELIKEKLKANSVIIYGDTEKDIEKVAVCGGAGAFLAKNAIEKKADFFLTSDVKYHEAIDYMEDGLIIADCGHFASENQIIYHLQNIIENMTDNEVYTYSKTDDFRTFI